MKSRNLYLMVIIAFALLLMAFAPISTVNAQVRTGNLRILYYSDPILAYGALTAGDIDLMIWPLDKSQYATAITNPNIVMGPVSENGMREFDLNGNETIAAYPGINSPTSYWQFRAALACITDKQYIVNNILGGFASRMDVPIVVNAPSWINASVVYPNYPWEYNPVYAATLLNGAGFAEGNTPNPDYDSGFPGSAHYIRVYPNYAVVHDNPHVGTHVTGPPYVWTLTFDAIAVLRVMGVPAVPAGQTVYKDLSYVFSDAANTVTVTTELTVCTYLWIEYTKAHPKAGQDLDPIRFFSRSDDPNARLLAGNLLRDNMLKAGIPVQYNALPSSGCRPQVMTARNYHIYTGGWSLGRYPTSIYGLYETSHWYPDGSDYVNPPCPRPVIGPSAIDPNLDVYAKAIYYTTDIPSAIVQAQAAESIIVKKCVNIPLWTARSFYAWRSWLLGVVNEMGYGPLNGYTFMNAYKAAGAPEQTVLRLGMNQPPQSHNILYAQWTYDYALLDRYWEGGIGLNPYDLGRDQPWIVEDWTPTTWVDPDTSTTKTACIFWLRKDVKWAAPVTGNYIRPFTTHDVEFSNMFYYFFSDGWNWDNVADVDHIEILDDYTYKICFSSVSYWFQYAANYPYLPKKEWGAEFCTPTVYNNPAANYAAGSSLYLNPGKSHGVAQIQNITVNGVLFTNYWTRFNSTGNAYSANRIYFNAAVSGNLVVNYWNITKSAKGYFPGSDTDWIPTSYSIGEWIPVTITKDTWAVFKRNDYFFLDTPPLGEIDWYWWWDVDEYGNPHPARDTTRPLGGPRIGAFVVDIYDVTYATVSYDSKGYLEPTVIPPWFPGADLAPSYTVDVPYGGWIDIYDVTTILVSYGQAFGAPPLGP